ncbi:MAG TPA: lipid-binding SYLF domain-containing protein [Casimicrobiaceae bacterium]|jgi:lipid-binding SYLF domain-containing protein
MIKRLVSLVAFASLALTAPSAWADAYSDTIDVFKKAGQSGRMFNTAYGYAVFPTIGKGGLVVGAAHGDGKVYEKGRYIGDTSLTQLSVGFQAGGQAYSEIIFFENEAALKTFTSGNFEFGADASAVAVTLAADAKANTAGASASASTSKDDARTAGRYYKGMAIYTVAKGGLMFEAAVAGQKFNYKPRK